jgi:uncharacterized membrane protein
MEMKIAYTCMALVVIAAMGMMQSNSTDMNERIDGINESVPETSVVIEEYTAMVNGESVDMMVEYIDVSKLNASEVI